MKADERRAHWFIMTSLRFENQSASENWGPTLCAAPSSNSSIRVLNDPSISLDYDSAFRTAFVKSMLSRALNENSIVSFLFFYLFFFLPYETKSEGDGDSTGDSPELPDSPTVRDFMEKNDSVAYVLELGEQLMRHPQKTPPGSPWMRRRNTLRFSSLRWAKSPTSH